MSSAAERQLEAAIEILPGRLYWVPLGGAPPQQAHKNFFCIDNDLIYWNFFLDFGPLNLGHLYRYCALLNSKLSEPKLKDKVIYHYCGNHPHKRANSAFLITAWTMLYLSRSPEDAFRPFQNVHPSFPPWHDATPGMCSFNLTVLDTLRGLHKACECGFFDFAKFNIEEYEHYEQVENGDLNWTLANKFIAFAGPHATRESHPGGYTSLCPEDYVSYFKRRNVKLVVRLNKKYYDARKFTQHGIAHMELYFLDGSNPPDHLLAKFLEAVENVDGAVAVHCKAGLGRTGCVVGCYMMKHYRCTGEEVIGWLRICRPGSIIGPQQQWMKEMQSRMWREGDLMRSKRGDGNAGKPDLIANAKLAPNAGPARSGQKDAGVDRISSRMQGMQVSERREAAQNQLTAGGGGRPDARSLAAAAAAEEENKSQGDYLRQRRMLAAQELASGGAKNHKVNYNEEANSKESGAGARDGSGRIAKFFNSFAAK